MNIFRALDIDEFRFCSFLAFLLNKDETHDLGDTFLREFLKLIKIGVGNNDFKGISIELEKSYSKNSNPDIIINLPDANQIVIAIEAKINPRSVKEDQLKNQYEELSQRGENFILIYLTPFFDDVYGTPYDRLIEKGYGENVRHIFWNGDKNSIYRCLKSVLNQKKSITNTNILIRKFCDFIEITFSKIKITLKNDEYVTYRTKNTPFLKKLNEKNEYVEEKNKKGVFIKINNLMERTQNYNYIKDSKKMISETIGNKVVKELIKQIIIERDKKNNRSIYLCDGKIILELIK